MGMEIERRFLVADETWRARATGAQAIRQFYLVAAPDRTLRVRVVDGARAVLTLKAGAGLSRHEFEYPIPLEDAAALEPLRVGSVLLKMRHRVPLGALTVEIDVYEGALAGLVVAEIELAQEATAFETPAYLGAEITGDGRYSNAQLALSGAAPR